MPKKRSSRNQLTPEAAQLRREYQAAWRAAHRDRRAAADRRFWEKKANKAAQRQKEEENNA